MQMKDFNTLVSAVASDLTEQDAERAAVEVERQLQGRAWTMNQPLNMIAYEDQA